MAIDFPEITSFGTLLGYALALETALGELASQAGEREACAPWRERLQACARKHGKRAQQLERFRRERLNEVVLQTISGMNRADYLPPMELPDDGAETAMQIAGAEDRVAKFYRDAAVHATHVLGGLVRSFAKMMKQSTDLAAELRAE
ncbi:MAG: hypothetical protein KAY32_16275 [Candidatus Eisenbacteria sp.]|nr:hypothetical protein [Candidatus Eisenbacteria bacterium]